MCTRASNSTIFASAGFSPRAALWPAKTRGVKFTLMPGNPEPSAEKVNCDSLMRADTCSSIRLKRISFEQVVKKSSFSRVETCLIEFFWCLPHEGNDFFVKLNRWLIHCGQSKQLSYAIPNITACIYEWCDQQNQVCTPLNYHLLCVCKQLHQARKWVIQFGVDWCWCVYDENTGKLPRRKLGEQWGRGLQALNIHKHVTAVRFR